MTPYLLLQIVAVPLAASCAMLLVRPGKNAYPAWIVIAALAYTTLLLVITGAHIYSGEILLEHYKIGPDVSFDLMADGLSLPVALIINLICLALAFYSVLYQYGRPGSALRLSNRMRQFCYWGS